MKSLCLLMVELKKLEHDKMKAKNQQQDLLMQVTRR